MPTLEDQHMETVEEAIEVLHTDDYGHQKLIAKMNQLYGYLKAQKNMKLQKLIDESGRNESCQ